MKKDLYKIALLSSTLFLVGCGGSSGGGSSSAGDMGGNQDKLAQTQSELRSIQDQEAKVLSQLSAANQEVDAKKKVLDDLQAKLAAGNATAAEVTAAQTAYEQASAKVVDQEKKKAELADQARRLKEKFDTFTTAVRLDSALNNVGPAVLSGTFSQSDFKIVLNAINTKSAAELVAPANKFITDTKSGLSTGAKISAAFPKLINSPITDSIIIPWFARNLGNALQARIEGFVQGEASILFTQPGKSAQISHIEDLLLVPFVNVTKGVNRSDYKIELPIPVIIRNSTHGLAAEIGSGEWSKIDNFIKDYFTSNSSKVKSLVDLNLTVGDPKVLQASIRQEILKLKPVALDLATKMPSDWFDWFAQLIPTIPNVDEEVMRDFKADMAQFSAQALSGEGPVSRTSKIGHRQARSGVGGVALRQFALDGNTLNQSYALDMPLRVDLKGSITSGKLSDVVGSVNYNLNGTVVGLVQGYNNMVDLHSETSVLLSQSLGNFFMEAQAGYVGVREGQFSGWEGQRYQATFGYDAAALSSFVQVEYRPLSNGFSTLDATGVYVGLESDVMTVELADATFTSSILAKVGYESATETMFGQSLKPNQSAAAFIEWNAGLKLSQGLDLKSALTLGSKDQSVKLNVAFEQ